MVDEPDADNPKSKSDQQLDVRIEGRLTIKNRPDAENREESAASQPKQNHQQIQQVPWHSRWLQKIKDDPNACIAAIAALTIAFFTIVLACVSRQQYRLEKVVEAPVFDFQPEFSRSSMTVAMDFMNKGKTLAKEVEITGSVARKGIDGVVLEGPYNIPQESARLVPPESHKITRLIPLNAPPGEKEVIEVHANISYWNGLDEKQPPEIWCEILVPNILGGGPEGRWIECGDLHVLFLHATMSGKGAVGAGITVVPPAPTLNPTPSAGGANEGKKQKQP